MADIERLAQAVGNLLTNAAKYGESRGKVSLGARAEGGEVVIRVRDYRHRDRARDPPTIFDLFVQDKRALDRAPAVSGSASRS